MNGLKYLSIDELEKFMINLKDEIARLEKVKIRNWHEEQNLRDDKEMLHNTEIEIFERHFLPDDEEKS